MYDILIKNGQVVDGFNVPSFKADIGIKDERIVAIGNLRSGSSQTKLIEAKDKVVCPGFIDIHSHSDFTILVNPKAESKVRQGVTTEVCGNCGFSAAPQYNQSKERIKKICEEFEINYQWSSLKEYLEILKEMGIGVNFVPLIGQGNIRASIVGYENRRPTLKEVEKMKKLISKCMEEGAFGLSTGLIYPPGCFTQTDELIEICKTVAESGGMYVSHLRSEGDRLEEAVQEAIDIGGMAGVLKVHISHLKTAGRANWNKLDSVFAEIEKTRELGLSVTCDRYPYTAASTDLDVILPSWAYEGGMEKELERLKDEQTRNKISKQILNQQPDFDSIMISAVKTQANKWMEGKRISEIAQTKKISNPIDLIFLLLIEEEGKVEVILFDMSEDNLKKILKKTYTMIGSDASARADYGMLSTTRPHPRAFGTFPRTLAKYVYEEKVLSLEEAIYKMTYQPAYLLGIKNRGRLKEGNFADIVVFNPEKIKDLATFESPLRYPGGIEYVIINGQIVIEQGNHTSTLSGKVIRKGQ
ncbi:MAG: D-aminoacylase [bacterium]